MRKNLNSHSDCIKFDLMNAIVIANDEPQLIRKSNELIEARYRLSIWEQRLILTLLSGISKQDEDFKRYYIRVSDFAQIWHLQSDNSLYEKVQEAADSLVGKTIQISEDPNVSETVSWLAYVKYIRGSGMIEMEFHSSLKPYLLQLKGYYTQYQLGYVVNFKSQYSIRFYELLRTSAYKARNSQFERKFSYEELRTLLSIKKKEYPLFADFKRWILNSAVKEICNNTDLDIIDVKYGKTGRKTTHITLSLKIRDASEVKTSKLEIQEQKDHPIIQRLINLDFAIETAKQYKNKYGVKRIERNIAYSQAKKDAGLLRDFPSYLNKAIVEDMAGAWEQAQAKEQEQKAELAERAKQREKQAELAYLKRFAERGDVPLEDLLPKEQKGG